MIELPDLREYRADLLGGQGFPLRPVTYCRDGLLSQLPPSGGSRWPHGTETERPLRGTVEDYPTISIVVPSYQQGRFLEETLRSVLLQNYPRLELIVIDGGSSDESVEVIEKYRDFISYWRSAPDRGQAHAINLGLSLASGDLRGWLNSDDCYLPGALVRVAERFRKKRANLLYGDALVLHDQSGALSYAGSSLALGRYVKFPGLVPSHATFWNRDIEQPLWEDQHCALDYELWIRILPDARVSHLRHPLGVIRVHSAAKTTSNQWRAQWEADAGRNGQAHPELYGPRPWLDLEFRLAQRIYGFWLRQERATAFKHTLTECGLAQSFWK